MTKATIYHNPKCSKSRQALALLEKNNIEIEVIEYLKTPFTKSSLAALLHILDSDISDIMRHNETIYSELSLKLATQEELFDAVIAHPILLQRPIVIIGKKAVVARPPELLLDLL